MASKTGFSTFYKTIKIDKLVKSQKAPVIVIPVKTGIQENQLLWTPAFAGVTALEPFSIPLRLMTPQKNTKNKFGIFYYASKTSEHVEQPTATQADLLRRDVVLRMCCGSGSGFPSPSHGLSF